jgi:hypothetical protein
MNRITQYLRLDDLLADDDDVFDGNLHDLDTGLGEEKGSGTNKLAKFPEGR